MESTENGQTSLLMQMRSALFGPLVGLIIVIFFLLLVLFCRFFLLPYLLQNILNLLMLFIDCLVPINIVFSRYTLDFFAQCIAVLD